MKKIKIQECCWFETELPKGFIIKINGIPFELTTVAKIGGNINNFYAANLLVKNKYTSWPMVGKKKGNKRN